MNDHTIKSYEQDDLNDIKKKIDEVDTVESIDPCGELLFITQMRLCGMSKEGIDNIRNAGFCTAPASTKYHLNYKGGLLEHSLNVMIALQKLTGELHLEWERPESPIIIGLLHDLCKTDIYKSASDTGYIYDDTPIIKGHGMKSVIYIQQLGKFALTDEEVACIVYHMGAFTSKEEWNDYTNAIHKYPNVLWTHTADMMATHIMEV